MQKMVEDIFTQIPNRGMEKPKNEPNYSISPFQKLNKIIRYSPTANKSYMVLSIILPPQEKYYKTGMVNIPLK